MPLTKEDLENIGLVVDEKLDKRFKEYDVEMDKKLDSRFIAQDKRWEKIFDKRFAEYDTKMDKRFAEQDAKMDKRFAEQDAKMDKRFAEQDANIDKKLDRRFAEQDVKIGKMFVEQNEMINKRFTEYDQKFEDIQEVLSKIPDLIRATVREEVQRATDEIRIEFRDSITAMQDAIIGFRHEIDYKILPEAKLMVSDNTVAIDELNERVGTLEKEWRKYRSKK